MESRPLTCRHGLQATFATALAAPLTQTLDTQPAAAGSRAAPRGGQLAVMSFNLRYASEERPNSWTERRPVMRELLLRESPQVIGTQEGLYQQLRDIESDLGSCYGWIGTGRAGGSRDEFMAVFYDTTRLAPLAYDHFWLSDTPNLIGSNTWGGGSIRMVTWVRFTDLRAGGQFYVVNTHLDNASQYARERAASLLVERLSGLEPGLPCIVTGDFNVAAGKNSVYDTLLSGGPLVDSWVTAAARSALYATFHGYHPPVPDGDRIDWILTSPGVATDYASIDTFSQGGQFPSDHLPVRATLTLPRASG